MINKPVIQTVGDTLITLVDRLKKTSETPALDSQNLLAHLLDRPRSWVLAHPEHRLTRKRSTVLEGYACRLEAGEPLPYVLGHWEFYGLDFEVTQDVLIPRPETELLVETALGWLQQRPDHRQVADVGTGSGCIGIALAVNVPDIHVIALDISPVAILLAMRNASKYGVDVRMDFSCCDLLLADSHYDLVVANLPYIPTGSLHKLPVYGREPTVALDGGLDGMALIRRLLMEATDHLVPGGLLLMEIESSQGIAALSLACDLFTEAQIHLHKDLSGLDRLLEIQV